VDSGCCSDLAVPMARAPESLAVDKSRLCPVVHRRIRDAIHAIDFRATESLEVRGREGVEKSGSAVPPVAGAAIFPDHGAPPWPPSDKIAPTMAGKERMTWWSRWMGWRG
jgi:hypothetical protein